MHKMYLYRLDQDLVGYHQIEMLEVVSRKQVEDEEYHFAFSVKMSCKNF